jgi:membrane-associated phospholipid phosphatase
VHAQALFSKIIKNLKHEILMKKLYRYIVCWSIVAFSSNGISTEARAGDFIENAGTVLSIALPATAGGMTVVSDDQEGTVQLIESTALTLGATYGLKYTISEERPNGGKHSFPSAHTSVSVAAAEFLRKRYGWEYGIPAYLAAGFVGYSRVEAKAHHVHDVLAGAAIGIISNMIFTTSRDGWYAQASANNGFYALGLSRSW